MKEYEKQYSAFRIDREANEQDKRESLKQDNNKQTMPLQEATPFYEIEYDAGPFPGVGKYVLKTQKIEKPVRDEVRELFNQMRDIARGRSFYSYNSSKFYDKRVQQDNSRIFYEQGMFMKDFADDYPGEKEYSSYFPLYQMMGYEQLRTYFTWRTKVRQGKVRQNSLSYAYLYIYELLCNIGVDSPKEGLERLLFFWRSYRLYDASIDKYMYKWLKDYHIYYELPVSFADFVREQKLEKHYPELKGAGDDFEVYCMISKYDILKSNFYTGENQGLIRECFSYVLEKLRKVFNDNHQNFDEAIFQPVKSKTAWMPFQKALFYPWLHQADRRVVISEKEIYTLSENHWYFSKVLTTENGRQLVGYILKETEAVLRRLTKYKYKLTADINTVRHPVVVMLEVEDVFLEKEIEQAVKEFHREATKTVVKVDPLSLHKIREEALMTQEKLIVPEEEKWETDMPEQEQKLVIKEEVQQMDLFSWQAETKEDVIVDDDPWKNLGQELNEMEKEVLRKILHGDTDIKEFSDQHGMMLEVLIDGINEKAMDWIGDAILDEELLIYDDYIEEMKEMVDKL